jgi:hypothetical protein
MNIQPAQQVPSNTPQSDQLLCLCHDTPDCPEQATIEINANQVARIAELLDVLDGFLRQRQHRRRPTGRLPPGHRTRPPPTTAPGQLRREPAHRPGQLHRPRPPRPPPTTARVSAGHR